MAALTIILFCALNVFHNVLALPTREGTSYKSEHCIKMTPEREAEINEIIERISELLNDITNEFKHYDIRLMKLDIESHSEDEIEEKELELQLTVHDCIIDDNEMEIITEEIDPGIEHETLVEKKEHDEIKPNNNTPVIMKDAPKDTATFSLDNESVQELMEILNELFTSELVNIDSDGNVKAIPYDESKTTVSNIDKESVPHNISSENSTVKSNTKSGNNENISTNVDNKNEKDNHTGANTGKNEATTQTTTCSIGNESVKELMEILNELFASELINIDSDGNVKAISYNENKTTVSNVDKECTPRNISAVNSMIKSNTKSGNNGNILASVDNTNDRDNHAGANIGNNEVTKQTSASGNDDPEIMLLDLKKLGQEVLYLLNKDKNKPLVVYVQETQGRNEYVFL